jgi:hypothetical protein
MTDHKKTLEHEAINAGCEAFISKPIDIRTFRKTIAMTLSAYCPGYFQ